MQNYQGFLKVLRNQIEEEANIKVENPEDVKVPEAQHPEDPKHRNSPNHERDFGEI